jgi:hypothetical protein
MCQQLLAFANFVHDNLLLRSWQVDEAAQAVSQWSALRSSNVSPVLQHGDRPGQQAQQRQQHPRSRLHEASLRVDDAATLDFRGQYEAQLAAGQQQWPQQHEQRTQTHPQPQLQQGAQQQSGQRQRLQV